MVEIVPNVVDTALLYFHTRCSTGDEIAPFVDEIQKGLPNTYIWAGDGCIEGKSDDPIMGKTVQVKGMMADTAPRRPVARNSYRQVAEDGERITVGTRNRGIRGHGVRYPPFFDDQTGIQSKNLSIDFCQSCSTIRMRDQRRRQCSMSIDG